MVFRSCQNNYSRLVVFVFLLVFRITSQKISLQSAQSRNEVDIFASPYVDTAFCRAIPGLTKYQIELCNQQPDTIMVALEGLNQAVRECQSQFDGNRWNCSSLSTRGKNPYISAILQKGYKETAFSYAISSAGVVVAVAKACSSAALQNCGCDEKIYKIKKGRQFFKENNYGYARGKKKLSDEILKSSNIFSRETNVQNNIPIFAKENSEPDQPIAWKWGGCSHNLKFGLRFSKMFLDSRETADDIHSKTNLHNNQVGRMAVKHNMKVRCKCHGISGSCQMKTCWRSTPDIKLVGNILKEKFKSAVMVDQTNLGSKNLRKFNVANPKLVNKNQMRSEKQWMPRKNKKRRDLSFDLLYYEKSPNFCDKNNVLDVPGTSGRLCNSTLKSGPSSCTSLCCGKGYNSVKQTKLERCHCKFIWCCEVKCDICNNTNWISVCK
ncbi:unnamed protein product [Ceutorhynchus assimilis]|uniref:Protein Wnt n=1 Tax=Ceutorhynchus assimilis TaxID=467358 RepID=A0A9P0GPX6_9CUCU|nr:unnamed protein product [Ceutorhynchus assimilis]